jgi:hypothetical protein
MSSLREHATGEGGVASVRQAIQAGHLTERSGQKKGVQICCFVSANIFLPDQPFRRDLHRTPEIDSFTTSFEIEEVEGVHQ